MKNYTVDEIFMSENGNKKDINNEMFVSVVVTELNLY